MLWEIFQHSKQQDFQQELVIFTITGIVSHTLPAYSVKREVLQFLHIYFWNSLGGRGPLFEAWRATFGPRATGWEPLVYSITNNTQNPHF